MYKFNYKGNYEFLFDIDIDLKNTGYELFNSFRGYVVSYNLERKILNFNLLLDLDEFFVDGRQYEMANIIYNVKFDLNKNEIIDSCYDIYVYKARQDVIDTIEKNLRQNAIFKIKLVE